jgi:hypothetical protein
MLYTAERRSPGERILARFPLNDLRYDPFVGGNEAKTEYGLKCSIISAKQSPAGLQFPLLLGLLLRLMELMGQF